MLTGVNTGFAVTFHSVQHRKVTRISGGPPPRGLARLRAHPSGLVIAATGPPGRLRRFRARLPNEAEGTPGARLWREARRSS
eukprot:tig00001373_g8452.t1